MELLTMLRTSSVLLAITAVGGVVMAAIRFSGKPSPPSWLAMVHGLLAERQGRWLFEHDPLYT